MAPKTIVIIVAVIVVFAFIGWRVEVAEEKELRENATAELKVDESSFDKNISESVIKSGGTIHEIKHYNDDGTIDRVDIFYESAPEDKPVSKKEKSIRYK